MPLTAKGEKIKSAMEKTYGPEKAERVLYASKNAGKISGIDKADDGTVMAAPASAGAAADNGPGHIDPHPGKDALYHLPVSDDADPLAKAEARYDEDRLLEKIAAHCDTLDARLDACEEAMVRNGRDDANPTLEYLEKLNKTNPAKGKQIAEWGKGGQHPEETLQHAMAEWDQAVSNRTHMTR